MANSPNMSNLPADMQERLLTARINSDHRQLTGFLTTHSEENIKKALQKLLQIDISLRLKCKEININQLFQSNTWDEGGLQRLQTCFKIISKYGQNLLKTANDRPEHWRVLAFSNTVFVEKVDSIQGARNILTALGYTSVTQEGLSFPMYTQPDRESVARITADLLIVTAELEEYMRRSHPNPQVIDELIPLNLRIQQGCIPGVPPGGPHMGLPRLPEFGAQHGNQLPIVPGMAGDQNISDDIVNPVLPSVQGISSRFGEPMDDEEFHDAVEELYDELTGEVCDICGGKRPSFTCKICDSKRMCRECDSTWHNHPRRKTHVRQSLNSVTSNQTQPYVGTGAKPKVRFNPSKQGHMAGDRFNEGQDQFQANQRTNPQHFGNYQGENDNVPILSIFEREAPSVRGMQPQQSPTSQFDESKSIEGATGSMKQRKSVLVEIKAISNKDDRISRIKKELGGIDRLLDQYKQEINVIFKRDDDFEDNLEYQRLSKERERLNRDKLLIDEHWKELAKEQFEHKKKLSQSSSQDDMSPKDAPLPFRNENNSPVQIKYPPGSDFDFEKDMNFPPQMPGKSHSFDNGDSSKRRNLVKRNVSAPQGNESGYRKPVLKKAKPSAWVCDSCTYHNTEFSSEARVCSVCGKTSDKPSLVYHHEDSFEESLEEVAQPPLQVKPKTKEKPNTLPKSTTTPNPEQYKSVFVEVQDQIFREKKEAQMRYQQTLERESDIDEPPVVTSPQRDHPTLTRQTERVVRQVTFIPEAEDQLKSVPNLTSNKPQTLRKSGDYVDMQSKLEQIQEQKRQEEANIQAKEVIRILRKAETEGYNMRELEMALEQTECIDPFKWINENWVQHIKQLAEEATVHLQAKQNSANMSKVSASEAKEALLECHGDRGLAMNMILCNREGTVEELLAQYDCDREHVIELLQANSFNKASTERALIAEIYQPYLAKLWAEDVPDEAVGLGPEEPEDHSLPIKLIKEKLRDKNLDMDDRMRMVLCEFQHKVPNWARANTVVQVLEHVDHTMTGLVFRYRVRMVLCEFQDQVPNWGRANTVVQVLEQVDPTMISLDEVVEAVKQSRDRYGALNFLQQECAICVSVFPANMILSTTACECKVCRECMKGYFDVQIKEKHIKNLCCPACENPDIESINTSQYLIYLDNFLRELLSQEVYDLFQDKVRDWHLMQDPNFRWCSTPNCINGFIFNPEGHRLKMRCDKCLKFTCFKCKQPWEEQHAGITCEEFRKWKEENNPEYQEAGLARHLQDNGIDCPKCSMRYSLAKGGCMHFKCTQCGHEFCCGCNKPFMQVNSCKEMQSCRKAGLHCHHPRDCLYYLRDLDIPQLQELLRDNEVEFKIADPQQNDKCHVMEQKEVQTGLKDEPCMKAVEPNQAGLCAIHYKEYLVSNINRNHIDPVSILDLAGLNVQYVRRGKRTPPKQPRETETQYKQRLVNDVCEKFPLERRVPVIV